MLQDQSQETPGKENRSFALDQTEERILAEGYIQVSKDPNVENDQNNDTFWYKVLSLYNEQAKRNNSKQRNNNMLTRKWTPMNREVGKFNSLVEQTNALSDEINEDLRNQGRLTEQEPELFGDVVLPRPHDTKRRSKCQRSTNSPATSDSQKEQFQEFTQQQIALDSATKMEQMECETMSRVEVSNAKKGTRT
ncbi:hypothetical protein Tco_0248123 [Tanacetum coccineum]